MKGKFIERGRYMNPVTGKQFHESDMVIGSSV
jgi:hypothetical protein